MKNKLMKNKKGALSDLFIFMVLAFALSIIVVIMVFGFTKVYDGMLNQAPSLQKALDGTGQNATQLMNNTVGKALSSYDVLKWATGVLIIGMALSILIGSFLVRVHPIFFAAHIIVTIIAVIVSVPMSNVYETVYNNPVLAPTFAGFWSQSWIMLHLPIWVTVIGFLSAILLFINMVRESGGYA